MRDAPAAVPVALLVGACALAPALRPTPSWAALGLLAAAIAWGGRRGLAIAAIAVGLMLGDARRVDEPRAVDGRVVELEGRLCGPWRAVEGLQGRTARLCAEWLSVGGQRTVAPPRIWIDLQLSGSPPPVGSRLRARGTLSRFGGLANATETAPGPWRLRVKSPALVRRVGSPGAFARANGAMRARVDRAIAESGAADRPGVALARALVLGDESGLAETRRRALRRAGLAHLFAVSGFNLTLVAGFVTLLAGAGGSRGLRAALPAAAVLVYLATVGPEPSMLRASVMSGLGLTIFLARRWTAPSQTLALSAAALVLAEPTIVDDVGFRLSFGATAGLVHAARRWREPLARLPRPVATALAASCAAQAGALPFSVGAFAEVAPVAPLWNLLAVPWSALWLLFGMAWIALALVSPLTAGRLAGVLDPGALPFAALERLPSSPWGSVPVAGGLPAGVALAGAVAALFESRVLRRLSPLAVAAMLCLGAGRPAGVVAEVAFLDVAQGDAALVRTARFGALIDGGGLIGRDLGVAALRPALARRGLSRLDVVVLSHSDRDHCQGLLDLAAALPIGELWSSPGQLERGCGARLAAAVGGRARVLVAGMRLERDGARFEVWHPVAARGGRSSNAESLVVAMDLAGRRFVFTGDISAAEEAEVGARSGDAAIDVLKVAHHGAGGSTSPAWLARLRPRLAILSVGGRNPYGHPSPASLARLRAAGSVVLRTDRDGEIALVRRDTGPWRIELPGSPRRMPPRS